MAIFSKKYSVKIPEDVSIIYSGNKKVVYFIGSISKKLLKLKVKIYLNQAKNVLQVSGYSLLSKISGNQKKILKALQGTTTALIKQIILEISVLFHKKLKLVGVGYKVFPVEIFEHKLLQFKLGYSHQVYFKIPNNLKVFCLKITNFFIFGNSYKDISQILSMIRQYKKPDPYKGKGILYEHEKILLKEGKKI
jgi:large subunit ribosomal protein L6